VTKHYSHGEDIKLEDSPAPEKAARAFAYYDAKLFFIRIIDQRIMTIYYLSIIQIKNILYNIMTT